MKAALIGFGDLGKQILSLLQQVNECSRVIAFDDIALNKGEPIEGITEVFAFNDYKRSEYNDYNFFICLGYKHLSIKNTILKELKQRKIILPSLIHPTSFVHKNAKIGDAVYLYPMCNVDDRVVIGDGTLLNNSVTVSHDTEVGNCCYICPGVTMAGFISIKEQVFIGTGSIISNGVTIGDNVIAGVGSVITKSVEANASVIGNPLRILDKTLRLS